MVGKRQHDSEDDLFPRGRAPDSTPRVQKRNGQTLFASQLKRPRTSHSVDTSSQSSVLHHGASLSISRLSIGMTLLALVTRADRSAIELVLPGGIRAAVANDEYLLDEAYIEPKMTDSDDESSTDVSDDDTESIRPAWEVVTVGSVTPAAVVDLHVNEHGKKLPKLSFKPHLVNVGLNPSYFLTRGFTAYGAIKSVEDHGYVVSFGANIPHTAFLPFENSPENPGRRLCPGTPVMVVTTETVKLPRDQRKLSAAVRVSALQRDVLRAAVDAHSMTYQDLQAGMLLRSRIVKEGPGGVSLSALGVFNVDVDAWHVPRKADGSSDLTPGKHVLARLLYVDPAQKRIGATLLDNYVTELSPRAVPPNWKTGTCLKPLQVERVQPGFGLFLRFVSKDPDSAATETGIAKQDDGEEASYQHVPEGNVPIFAHISRISDSKGLKIESRYRNKSIIKDGARVVSVSRFDGVINVDLRPSVLSRKALSLDEIEVGSVYECKILSHTTMGSVMVAIDGDPYLPGIVLPAHLSDVPIPSKRLTKHPAFRIGASIKCRALSVISAKDKVFLTARKSLVSPKYPILTSYDQALEALKHHRTFTETRNNDAGCPRFTGITKCVTQRGSLLVDFCNMVVGLVPTAELCLDSARQPSQSEIEDLYPVGETVHVRLLKVDPKNRRMLLSMSLEAQTKKTGGNKFFRLGQRVKARIKAIDMRARHFIVAASAATLQGPGSGRPNADSHGTCECYLPFGHLSDNAGVCERLIGELQLRVQGLDDKGASSLEIREAMVLCYREDVPVITVKSSLITANGFGRLPGSFDEIKLMTAAETENNTSSRLLRGYIKALLPGGAIIGLMGDCVGFVRNSRVSDRFVSDPARALNMHQSVSAIIESVDESSKRFSLSMRPSDIGREGIIADTLSLFKSLEGWRKVLGVSCTENEFQIGNIINASVNSVSTYGVKYNLKAGKRAVVGVAYGVTGDCADVVMKDAKLDECEPTSQTKSSDSKLRQNPTPSTMERVRILDIDPMTGVVDVSRDENVIAQGAKKSVISPGAPFVANVVLVKSAYVILAVKRSKSRTAIAYALGPVSQDNLLIRPGAEVECVVLDKTQANTVRNLVMVDWQSFRRTKKIVQLKPTVGNSESTRTISALQDSANVDEARLIGMRIAGKVTRKFRLHAYVGIAPGIVGHLHLTNTSFLTAQELSELSLGIAPSSIASKYSLPELGTNISVAYFARLRRPADAEASDPVTVEMSLCKERCSTWISSVGEKVIGFVKRPSSRFTGLKEPKHHGEAIAQTLVAISPTSLVSCADVDCLFDENVKLQEGTPVICQVIGLAEDGSRARGALSANGENLDEGFLGLVQSVYPGRGLRVSIPWHARDEIAKSVTWGFVDICDVADNFDETENLMNELQPGSTVRIYAISTTQDMDSEEKNHVWLSMRAPRQAVARDPLIAKEDLDDLKEGSPVRGFVRGIGKKGCFVSIGRHVVAQVRLCDLADEFVKDPKAEFPTGKLVSGLAYKVKAAKRETRISLVLRRRPRKELRTVALPSELKEGSKVCGVVQHVAEYGALIEIAPGLRALLHKSEADQDRFIQDPREEWMLGQKITAIVVRTADGKIKVGTKRCYFEAAGIDDSHIDELLARNLASRNNIDKDRKTDTSGENEPDVPSPSEERRMEVNVKNHLDSDDEAPSEAQNSFLLNNGTAVPPLDMLSNKREMDFLDSSTLGSKVPPLDVSADFDFSEAVRKHNGADFTEEKPDDQTRQQNAVTASCPELSKKSSRDKREKKRLREAVERDIRIREEALANNPDAPETAEDFERLLLGDPNSSVLWIRYMAFCVQLSQIDKARSIAERALETISLHAEEERVNVWCAYVNLEAQFGSINAAEPESNDRVETKRSAAVFRVFERACERITDVKEFHLQVSSALRRSFSELADEVLRRGVRRFKDTSELWIALGKSEFKKGDTRSARRTQERALMAVDKKEHVHLIIKYAQFEYRYGSAERGRTVFESLIGKFQKRVDLWNIYLDMEIGQCGHARQEPKSEVVKRTRQLFERFTTLDLSSKKMKFAFKKWLRFEKAYGTNENEAEVKSRARTYVDRNVTGAQNETVA